MIKHLIKLVWNRKWTNLRIAIQILLSFLVVFAVVVWAVYYYNNYRKPLGFAYENIIHISVTPNNDPAQGTPAQDNLKIYSRLLAALHEFDDVESAGLIGQSPYLPWEWFGKGIEVPWKGRKIFLRMNYASYEIKDVLGMKVIKGQWFNRDDNRGINFVPIIMNAYLEREIFEGKDGVGKILPNSNYRVIGVIDEFRVNGELAEPGGCMFFPFTNRGNITGHILARVRPGLKADFDEKVIARLKAEARGWWIFDAKPLAEMRESINRPRLIPVAIGAIIAGFLLIMVALGLTGVLWLNVTRRTREIGLRRAKGATRGHIYRQILGELSIVTIFGLLVGVLVLVQLFPMLKFLNFVSTKVYIASIVISMAFVYILSILCGLYPGLLAAKVNPAEALHYE
jgi:putative ABC transport system permease protein